MVVAVSVDSSEGDSSVGVDEAVVASEIGSSTDGGVGSELGDGGKDAGALGVNKSEHLPARDTTAPLVILMQ